MQVIFQLNSFFELIEKVYNFSSIYLFEEEEQWGTEYDWRIFLTDNPNSTLSQKFIKLLISRKILIKNNNISKQAINTYTYRLTDDFQKKIKLNIIELTPEFLFLNRYYEIYNK